MAPAALLTSTTLLKSLRAGEFVGTWVLDAARSEVRFKSRYLWGLVPVKGKFRQVSGNASVSVAGDVIGMISVAAASVDTNDEKRDELLRSANLLDAAKYPDIHFNIEGATPYGWGASGWGRLTIRGTTCPLFFDAAVSSGDGEAWVDAEVQINRADFGLTWNRLRIASMDNSLTVHLVFTHQMGLAV
jgi:polyisoprenoid-binding protein YceI